MNNKWVLLGLGTVVSLAGLHGRWEVLGAVWLYPLLLLRFTRTTGVLLGTVGVTVATMAGSVYWLHESGLPVLGPMLPVVLVLSLPLALPYLIDRLLPSKTALVFPLSVVAVEYLVGAFSPVGNVMNSLAATQHDNLPLLQLASVTGSYGISFLIAWFAAVGNDVWEHGIGRAKAFAVVAALVMIGGSLRLGLFPPDANTVRVAGVSPARSVMETSTRALSAFQSPEQLGKGDHATVSKAFAPVNDSLLEVTEREAKAGAKLVVWPEAGAGVQEVDRQALVERIGEVATRTGAYVEAGMVVFLKQAPWMRNEAVLVDPRGKVVWTYQKAHPVPGMDPFPAGDGVVPTVDSPFGRLANVICFDADFPTLLRQPDEVDVMLVPANDWYGFGAAHTEKAVMRAVENGYGLVRQDSNGLSAAFDHQGRVLASTDYFTTDQQVMVAYVPTEGTSTIYGTVGDAFAWLSMAGLVALVFVRRRHSAVP